MEMHRCFISERSIELVNEVLRSGWISEGVKVREFEEALIAKGLRNPVAVNSGTSAIHLGLVVAGVEPGDEIILPAQTFVATGMAVLMAGAVPVFADIDPHTGNICPESIKRGVSHRTKAVVPVHWAGLPVDLSALKELSYSYELTIVEDAAHAFGAEYKGDVIGSISRFTAFSFQSIKHLTTGDGGALCCQLATDETKARRGRWFGWDRSRPTGPLGERTDKVVDPGFKYHMNDLAAAVGLGNLEGFPYRLARRRDIDNIYRKELEGVKGLSLLKQYNDRTSACWIFSVLVDRRTDFVLAMKKRGIPCSVINSRIDRHPVFGGVRSNLPGQAEFDAKHIALPCHDGLTDEDVYKVVEAVKGGW